ncbi:MAG: DUF1223 domain-containing protein [Geminicoccaceae bacterium]|nr:DUF1223 domain-containing protein [Geminicoccaceae bacterium]
MHKFIASLVAGIFVFAALSSEGSALDRPVVVELFTSQGCNSCPPADRLLGELAKRPDVLALSFHVTYWDRLGWPDTFGLAAATDRQWAYARVMDRERVYTPQMVIDGRAELVGSRRPAVMEVIQLLKERQRAGPDLRRVDDLITVGSGSGGGTVWLARFERRHDVEIRRGENAGRTLAYHNVVRELRPLGRWQGEAARFPLTRDGSGSRSGLAVLLQADDGRILNALRIEAAD